MHYIIKKESDAKECRYVGSETYPQSGMLLFL
jgi:hypothetical protein